MSIPRLALGLAAALFSSMVSLDPRVSARLSPPRVPRPLIAASKDAAPAQASSVQPLATPPPADLSVEVRRDPHGRGHNVVVSRTGHLVALGHGSIRGAGKDWASLHIDTQGSAEPGRASKKVGAPTNSDRAGEIDSLVWETTPLGALTTERGLVSLSMEGAELRARLLLTAPPTPVGRYEGAHHSCSAHRDASGGYVLVCRVHHGGKQVSALNLTGSRALDGAWVIPGKEPFVRLDLPLSPGLAEARLIGFVHGLHGAVIRAEAAWVPGEEPTLLVEESERAQPAGPGF
ncbi:MAG: hypothetical protein ABI193_17860 [Minicystis sp.]